MISDHRIRLRRTAFVLLRDEDPTGFSGVGLVAEGVQFDDGHVALRWCVADQPRTTVTAESIEDIERIHGHDGRTRVVWLDLVQPPF